MSCHETETHEIAAGCHETKTQKFTEPNMHRHWHTHNIFLEVLYHASKWLMHKSVRTATFHPGICAVDIPVLLTEDSAVS